MFLVVGLIGLAQYSEATSRRHIGNYYILKDLNNALVIYYEETSMYPSTKEGLKELIVNSIGAKGWNGPYLVKANIPLDAWGEKYIYYYPSRYGTKEFDLYSKGRNMKDDYGH